MPINEYRIRLASTVTPIEIDDGRHIHSNINAKLHGLLDLAGESTTIDGTITSTKDLYYKQYTTTTVEAILEYELSVHGLGAINSLVLSIVEAGSTGTPDCMISIDGTNFEFLLSGVGDHIVFKLADIAGNVIKIKSSGATELAVIDILAMYENQFLREVASRNLMTSADEFLRVGSD